MSTTAASPWCVQSTAVMSWERMSAPSSAPSSRPANPSNAAPLSAAAVVRSRKWFATALRAGESATSASRSASPRSPRCKWRVRSLSPDAAATPPPAPGDASPSAPLLLLPSGSGACTARSAPAIIREQTASRNSVMASAASACVRGAAQRGSERGRRGNARRRAPRLQESPAMRLPEFAVHGSGWEGAPPGELREPLAVERHGSRGLRRRPIRQTV